MSPPVKITFDSNVWERICSNEITDELDRVRFYIFSGKIVPFITVISLSIEAIARGERREFFLGYVPKVEIYETGTPQQPYKSTMSISPDASARLKHLTCENLKEKLRVAQRLGFKVLPMTNFGTTRNQDVPSDMLVEFLSVSEFWGYAERLSECSSFIESINCGFAQYQSAKIDSQVNSKKFARAVAEWADGDSVSAHYAFGNDIFCTNDKAGSAGLASIFHPQNVVKLAGKFGIKIMSLNEIEI